MWELAHLINSRQHPTDAAEAIIASYNLIRQENCYAQHFG